MKKKTSVRELREQAKQAKISGFKQKKQEEEEKKRAEEEQKKLAAENERKKAAREKAKAEGQRRKSSAKAAGLKSALYINESELLMTAFGRGNEAFVSKKVIDGKIIEVGKRRAFDADAGNKRFMLSGRVEGVRDDPSFSKKKSGTDMIGAKDALEKRYFGRTFEDNIHIQIAYCILDIEKILSQHINNVVYELDNLERNEGSEFSDDFIGYLTVRNPYDIFIDETHVFKDDSAKNNVANSRRHFLNFVKNPRLGYFGPAFYETEYSKGKEKRINSKKKTDKDIYTTLCLLGFMRQTLAHSNDFVKSGIYNMENLKGVAWIEARELLDRLYSQRVDELNKDFLETSAKNLSIIFRVMNAGKEQKAGLVQDYYDFTVRKTVKNLGFSIKIIREGMLALPDASEKGELVRTNKKYDSVRSKLNKILDFVLFEYYKKNPDIADGIVETLRACEYEAEKENVYSNEINRIWPEIRPLLMDRILPEMDGDKIKNMKPDPDISASMMKGKMVESGACGFSKLMYLLTFFLDGKEINDLLTQLISKFENIASFLSIASEYSEGKFTTEYKLFEDSKNVAAELRTINSFAHMELPDPAANLEMYVEAAVILGAKGSRDELRDYFSELLSKEGGPRLPNGKKNNGLRNFIASNVVSSRKFKYLVRYNNAEKTRALAGNRAVVDFVLKDIPDEQIARYYNACNSSNEKFRDDMRPFLADIITGMNFEDFKDAGDYQNGKSAEAAKKKEQKQAVIRLYLAVLYLLTKNLVYVNSRYFLAFHCYERDLLLLEGKKTDKNNKDYLILTQRFVDEGRLNAHATKYLKTNLAHADPYCINIFRNYIAHLAVIRNANLCIDGVKNVSSYFDLYHYIMQRLICRKYDFEKANGYGEYSSYSVECLNKVKKYGTTCKDFIKALNVPFGYNLARYKNLSIDGLFDKNRPGSGKVLMEIGED